MSVFEKWINTFYGDIDEERRLAAGRLGAVAIAGWRGAGVDDLIDMMDLEKFGIGSELYAREAAKGLSAEEIVERWGGP